MADQIPPSDIHAIRKLAAASGIELSDDRAERLAAALVRFRMQMAKVDRLDLTGHDPGVADPAAAR